MRVVITAEIIRKCTKDRVGWYNPCPITTTLRGMFPRTKTHNYVRIVNGVHILANNKEYRTPQTAIDFLVKWGKCQPAEPISFFLVVKNGRLDKTFSGIDRTARKMRNFWKDLWKNMV